MAVATEIPTEVEVLVVGAGVTGCSIAASLARAGIGVAIVERRHDIVDETSKSNSGVADCGWECEPGTLEAKLLLRASSLWEEIADRLDVPFKRCGAISLALTPEQEKQTAETVERAHENGLDRVRRLSIEDLRKFAPFITENALSAVEVPDEGIVDPIRLTLGYAELAVRNGARFLVDAPLVAASVGKGRIREVHTPRESFRPRVVINAAGLGADSVSRLLGGEDFEIWPRRGEYLLVDREFGGSITKIVTQFPTPHTRGVSVIPSTHGTVLLGPTAEDDDDKSDRATHRPVLGRVLSECVGLVPSLADAPQIKSYTGLRPASDLNYRVGRSEGVANLIQACGIRSTGVSASPAIGDHVRDLVLELGVQGTARRSVVDRIPKRLRLSEAKDCAALAKDPLGRTVVCACEKVTALEIHEALRSPVPARSVAGIAKRTRATWGRCQGSACLSGVTFIASMYHDGDAWSLPMTEPGSTLGVAGTDGDH